MEIEISGFKVLIDEDDYERVTAHKWRVMWGKAKKEQLYYFRSAFWLKDKKEYKDTFLHRFIMGCTHGDGNVVDHKNHNTLDCRKENLRICTPTQNTQNSRMYRTNKIGYKGIKQDPSTGHWSARIQTPDGVRLSLGTYSSAEDAAKAYDRASLAYFGEYAVTNFSKENYTEYDLTHLDQSTEMPSKSNSSGYVGVTWSSVGKNWKARYIDNGKTKWLGTYKDPYDAYLAREKYIAELKEGK
jgi:hypothetical protein